ncbi:hypothetical protein GCM10023214_54850 [Amycolatopsis dongchuanensis]|uniref:Uncharacterized protein n=1 Tax=Amycolatopsis dongchuanensis TaxID=1070866 RepID=A0ABP9R8T6_9PSEU
MTCQYRPEQYRDRRYGALRLALTPPLRKLRLTPKAGRRITLTGRPLLVLGGAPSVSACAAHLVFPETEIPMSLATRLATEVAAVSPMSYVS